MAHDFPEVRDVFRVGGVLYESFYRAEQQRPSLAGITEDQYYSLSWQEQAEVDSRFPIETVTALRFAGNYYELTPLSVEW